MEARVHRRLDPPAARHRPGRDGRVARLARRGDRRHGASRARTTCSPGSMERAREKGVGVPAMVHDRLHQHDPARAGAVVPRRRAHRAPHPRVHPLERGGRWSTARTTASTVSAATSRRTRRRPRSTRSASTTSSAARATAATATRSSSRATPRPGIYARAFLEGRLDRGAARPLPARGRRQGLPSYPHPRRMPDFWEFPTVSMGLGPLNAVYQARFNRYLYNREIADTSDAQGVVLRRRRRDGRARGDGRARRSRRASGSTT